MSLELVHPARFPAHDPFDGELVKLASGSPPLLVEFTHNGFAYVTWDGGTKSAVFPEVCLHPFAERADGCRVL